MNLEKDRAMPDAWRRSMAALMAANRELRAALRAKVAERDRRRDELAAARADGDR